MSKTLIFNSVILLYHWYMDSSSNVFDGQQYTFSHHYEVLIKIRNKKISYPKTINFEFNMRYCKIVKVSLITFKHNDSRK